MLSHNGILPRINKKRSKNDSNTKIDNNWHREHDHKQPQMTSIDLKRAQMTSVDPEVKPVKRKNKMKGSANIELNAKKLE